MNSVQSIESLIDIQSETKDGESYFNLSPIAEGK